MNVPHWKNWLACIKSREKPMSEIETCVRSSTACHPGESLDALQDAAGLGREELDGAAGRREAVSEGAIPGALEARSIEMRSARKPAGAPGRSFQSARRA